MSEHMRKRPIEEIEPSFCYKLRNKSPWRELFEHQLESHSEQGLYLKGLRLREGYTQAQLSKLIGIPQNNISAMEHGKRLIDTEVAHRLANVFNVNYQRFL